MKVYTVLAYCFCLKLLKSGHLLMQIKINTTSADVSTHTIK